MIRDLMFSPESENWENWEIEIIKDTFPRSQPIKNPGKWKKKRPYHLVSLWNYRILQRNHFDSEAFWKGRGGYKRLRKRIVSNSQW